MFKSKKVYMYYYIPISRGGFPLLIRLVTVRVTTTSWRLAITTRLIYTCEQSGNFTRLYCSKSRKKTGRKTILTVVVTIAIIVVVTRVIIATISSIALITVTIVAIISIALIPVVAITLVPILIWA